MTCTRKNLKIVCVKLIGKIGCMLVADIVYVIVQYLQPIDQTLWLTYKLLGVFINGILFYDHFKQTQLLLLQVPFETKSVYKKCLFFVPLNSHVGFCVNLRYQAAV